MECNKNTLIQHHLLLFVSYLILKSTAESTKTDNFMNLAQQRGIYSYSNSMQGGFRDRREGRFDIQTREKEK